MSTFYTDTPHNFNEIEPFVITDTGSVMKEIYESKKCYFYGTCSFRRHANLSDKEEESIAI